MSDSDIIYCADGIGWYQGRIVLVERLSKVPGLALVGGKQEFGETLTATIRREFWEETGFDFLPNEVFRTYAEPGRDPRGAYVSTVFWGIASGTPKNEDGKTRVVLLDIAEFAAVKERFVFDHGKILEDYIKYCLGLRHTE